MKTFYQFILEKDNNDSLTLFHGSSIGDVKQFKKLKKPLFLSTDYKFSQDCGKYLYKVTIKPKKIFDSTSDTHKKELLDYIIILKDKTDEKLNKLIDDPTELNFKEQYLTLKDKIDFYNKDIKNITNSNNKNTWFWIESIFNNHWTKDFMDSDMGLGKEFFESRGYDTILLTEWGITNYMIWSEKLITKMIL